MKKAIICRQMESGEILTLVPCIGFHVKKVPEGKVWDVELFEEMLNSPDMARLILGKELRKGDKCQT